MIHTLEEAPIKVSHGRLVNAEGELAFPALLLNLNKTKKKIRELLFRERLLMKLCLNPLCSHPTVSTSKF